MKIEDECQECKKIGLSSYAKLGKGAQKDE